MGISTNTRRESLLPQNAWDLNRWGRWWVGRKRGTGKGSDLPRATPSVNISPVSSEPYLRDLCTAWVFLTYWTSILWMLLKFQYWIMANGKAGGELGCWIYQWVYVGFYCFLGELSISPDLPLFRRSDIFLCKYRIFRASLSSQGNSCTMNWILFSLMWQKKTFNILLWSELLLVTLTPLLKYISKNAAFREWKILDWEDKWWVSLKLNFYCSDLIKKIQLDSLA